MRHILVKNESQPLSPALIELAISWAEQQATLILHDGIVWYADTVLSLYREESYDPYTAKKNQTEVRIMKSFYGDIGFFDLLQERAWGMFVERDRS